MDAMTVEGTETGRIVAPEGSRIIEVARHPRPQTPNWEELDFPVSLRPITVDLRGGLVAEAQPERFSDIPSVRGIYREDTGSVLDIVSTRYKLVPHGEIFRQLDAIVREMHSNVEYVNTRVGLGGGFASVEWVLDRKVEVAVGDFVEISLLAKNSLDRTSSLSIELSASRLVCTNGMRGPGPRFVRRWRHSSRAIGRDLPEWLETLHKREQDMIERWESWSRNRIPVERFGEFLESDKMAVAHVAQRTRDDLISRLREVTYGRPEITVWDGYNVLTEYASHHIRVRRKDILPIRQEAILQLANRFAETMSKN